MSTLFDNDYYENISISTTVDLRNTRFGYVNDLTEGSVTASNSDAGFDITSTLNAFTYDFWKPSALPVTITYDAGKSITADYLGLGAHNLANCEIKLSYSLDQSTYVEVVNATLENNNDPMILFTEVTARYWRIEIDQGTLNPTFECEFESEESEYYETAFGDGSTGDASLAVVYIGKALAMQRMIYGGHSPGVLSRNTDIRPTRSEGGQWLGRSVIRNSYGASFDFQNLTAPWYRANFDDFAKAARFTPFFTLWRPQGYASESLYGQSDGDIQPSNTGVNDFMSVSLSVRGYNGND